MKDRYVLCTGKGKLELEYDGLVYEVTASTESKYSQINNTEIPDEGEFEITSIEITSVSDGENEVTPTPEMEQSFMSDIEDMINEQDFTRYGNGFKWYEDEVDYNTWKEK